jgi:hypothetical protein
LTIGTLNQEFGWHVGVSIISLAAGRMIHHRGTETQRKTKSKQEDTEVVEVTEGQSRTQRILAAETLRR